jgi:hypothetical protein
VENASLDIRDRSPDWAKKEALAIPAIETATLEDVERLLELI